MPSNVELLGERTNIYKHEEADVCIISYAHKMALEGAQNIFIHTDDTDVFVLAVHWVHTFKIKANVIIRRLSNNENISINKVTEELGPLASNLLPLYILTGNDHL